MITESRQFTLYKTISWRFVATFITTSLVWIFTGSFKFAFTIGTLEVFLKMLAYYYHDRVWHRINRSIRLEPGVVWMTGLRGAGKTTISKILESRLVDQDYQAEVLDGEKIREIFPIHHFNREERDQHIRRAAYLAGRLEKQNTIVICALESPFETSRRFAREVCGNFVEVYLSTPLDVCEKRRDQSLYTDELEGAHGYAEEDVAYEVPSRPDLALDTSKISAEAGADEIMKLIMRGRMNVGNLVRKVVKSGNTGEAIPEKAVP